MNKIIEKKVNYGFQEPTIQPEDYYLGSGKLGSEIINPLGNWLGYLPKLEHQRKGYETQACVSFGTLSALEILHEFTYYVEPNYSDRFLAKASDTNPYGGNTPNKVSDTLRKMGTVNEELYPYPETLEEFYADIPDGVVSKGKEWLKNYDFGYEWVDEDKLKDALKRSPVGVAVDAWNQNEKGEYIRVGRSNHWCVLVAYDEQDRHIIWDSYDEGIKTLAKGYKLEFAQIYTLKKKPQKHCIWRDYKKIFTFWR